MITKEAGWKASDGEWFSTLHEAQRHDLYKLFSETNGVDDFISVLCKHSEAVIEILKSTGRKPRKKKPGRPKGSKTKSRNIDRATDLITNKAVANNAVGTEAPF